MINAEVQKTGTENVLSTIRKFSRRVQGTGIIKTLRAKRYQDRKKSKTVIKKRAIKLLARRSEYAKMVREGKIIESVRRTYQPRPEKDNSTRQSISGLGDSTPIAR